MHHLTSRGVHLNPLPDTHQLGYHVRPTPDTIPWSFCNDWHNSALHRPVYLCRCFCLLFGDRRVCSASFPLIGLKGGVMALGGATFRVCNSERWVGTPPFPSQLILRHWLTPPFVRPPTKIGDYHSQKHVRKKIEQKSGKNLREDNQQHPAGDALASLWLWDLRAQDASNSCNICTYPSYAVRMCGLKGVDEVNEHAPISC